MAEQAQGTLYVVATPIGNLEDITLRAVKTLKEADLIAAEDTRQTRKLSERFKIKTPLLSYHAHSDKKKLTEILFRLSNGESVALVTDAGTPAISDPGAALVELARAEGTKVVPIPGPAAVTAVVSASGLGGDAFTFLGFLPHKKGRQTKLGSLAGLVPPVVLYESPHRLVKLLAELDALYPQADVVVGRELTKKFEELRGGNPAELLQWYTDNPPKGEIAVVVRV